MRGSRLRLGAACATLAALWALLFQVGSPRGREQGAASPRTLVEPAELPRKRSWSLDPNLQAPLGHPSEGRPPAAGAGATVRVTVRDESGRIDPGGWAEAADCPSLRPLGSSADGELLYEASPGRCVLRAVRQDGLVRVEGDLGSVTVAPGEDAQVTLTLPSSSRGGVQLAFQPDREGARIRWLPEGSELALAGIRDGDVLVSADGRPLAGLEAAEVSAALTGPEGDEVQLEVLRRGDTGDLLETVVLRHARVE